jgi:nitroreductase/NAD-dependent dihydropyrimidine dehydrogenase PreA subunit
MTLPSCTGCGQCVAVCPNHSIALQGGRAVFSGHNCISCGHCVAVCPAGALDHPYCPRSEQRPVGRPLSAREAEDFLRSRRSIRVFRQRPIDREKALQLVNIGRYAQTGSNRQGIGYVIVDGRDKVEALAERTICYLERQYAAHPEVVWYKRVIDRHRLEGEDIIFRGAPALILAVAPEKLPSGRDNARFSLTYIELFAPALGLGTCWAGFFEGLACGPEGQEVREMLRLAPDVRICGALMLGEPAVRYQRLVERQPLQVEFR